MFVQLETVAVNTATAEPARIIVALDARQASVHAPARLVQLVALPQPAAKSVQIGAVEVPMPTYVHQEHAAPNMDTAE